MQKTCRARRWLRGSRGVVAVRCGDGALDGLMGGFSRDDDEVPALSIALSFDYYYTKLYVSCLNAVKMLELYYFIVPYIFRCMLALAETGWRSRANCIHADARKMIRYTACLRDVSKPGAFAGSPASLTNMWFSSTIRMGADVMACMLSLKPTCNSLLDSQRISQRARIE